MCIQEERFFTAKNREDLVKWCLKKAEEYLQSAQENIRAGRLFPAAEEIFRSVESALEALLYNFGRAKNLLVASARTHSDLTVKDRGATAIIEAESLVESITRGLESFSVVFCNRCDVQDIYNVILVEVG